MQSRTRPIAALIVVALISAAAGGWLAIAVFDSRTQVLAADIARTVSRKLDSIGARSGHGRRLDPGGQFRVQLDRTAKAR